MPDEVPDEYSRPDGTPYRCEVDDEIFAKIKASKMEYDALGKHLLLWRYGRMDTTWQGIARLSIAPISNVASVITAGQHFSAYLDNIKRK